MRYRVHLYNHQLPLDMQADPVEVDCSGPPTFGADGEFLVFTRDGTPVAMFRRELVQAVHELPAPGQRR